MTVFDKECRKIINDLSSDSGFFPVSQIGSWHSGIHISLNGMVECPVTGNVIDCNFSDMETSNYFVIESAITNKDQGVSYYSIISGLKSYKEMKERFEGKKSPDASACPLNVILNYFADKGLPYGVKAKLCVKNYKSPYVTICGEQKILGSFFYLNSSTNTSSTEDGTITERFAYGKMKIQACESGFINGNIVCGDYTISKGAHVSLPENNTLRVKGSSKIKFKLEETAGFFDLKKNGKTIGNYGNISFKGKERVEFYEKKELFKENISLIDKAQLERVSPLMAEIESEICAKRNYKILRSGQETPAKEQQYKMKESFERGRATLLEQKLKILKRLRSFLEKEENVAIVSKKVTPVDFYPMKASLHDNISKNLNVCIKYGTGNFAIYAADENLIVVDNSFLEDVRNKLDFKDPPSHKEIRIVKKREFDERITGLKTIVDGKGQNSRPNCYNGKSVCECRPYMFNNGYTYDFKINDGQKKLVFLKHQIIGWEDENVMKKDGIYVYSQDNQSFPSRILESDEEILAIESANEAELTVTLRSGSAHCGRDDCSLQVEFSDDRDFIGKTISKGTYLGDVNENYVDWAMFFKENIIDELKKMKRQRLCIPKGTACRKKVYTKLNLPQDTTIQLDGNRIELVNADLVLKLDQAGKEEIEIISEGNRTECAFTKNLSRLYIRTLRQYIDVKCRFEMPLVFEMTGFSSNLDKFHDYINMILKKIAGGRFKCELQYNKVNFYVIRVELTASDIAEFYGIQQPVCIEEDSLESARKKTDEIECELVIFNDGIIETEDCASLLEDYHDNDYHDGKYKQIELRDVNGIAKDYFEITQGDETYYIDNEILGKEGVVTDRIKEYRDSLIPLNFGSSIADENICPASKSLVCKLPELKEKLKDIDLPSGKGKLGACLDKKQSNYLYGPDRIYDSYPVQALSSKKYKDAVLYTSRLVSRHPMEFDADLYKRCCSDLGLCSSPSESHDVYRKIKDRLHASENSFYFLYPPGFMSMLDDAGLLEFNPYEDNTDKLPTTVLPVTTCVVKSNPGFAPYTGQDKYHGYASITGHFNDDYGSYYHEGTDFEGECGKTPVKALVSGKVVLAEDQGNFHYGLSLLIKSNRQEDGKNLFYLIAHLSRYETGIKIGAYVSTGQTVGYVGNTGNSSATHLHLSVYKTDKTNYLEIFKNGNYEIHEGDVVNPFNHSINRRKT